MVEELFLNYAWVMRELSIRIRLIRAGYQLGNYHNVTKHCFIKHYSFN